MEQILVCENCSLDFNLEDRCPKIMPCCGNTFCLNCVTNVIQAASEAEMADMHAAQGICKKCPSCNQLVVVSDTDHGLLNNNQVIKMIKHYHSPFL